MSDKVVKQVSPSEEELNHLAEQQVFARQRYHAEDAELIRESLVIEWALRQAPRQLSIGQSLAKQLSKAIERNIVLEAATDRSEVERLRRERDVAIEWRDAILAKCKACDGFDTLQWAGDKSGWGFAHYFIGHLNTRAMAAEATIAQMQEALEPFASAADAFYSGMVDAFELVIKIDGIPYCTLKVGDLRRAADALSSAPAPAQEPAGQSEAKPVAWRYEYATARIWGDVPGEYTNWRWGLSETEPHMPEGSIRNITPLYAHPTGKVSGDAAEVSWRYRAKPNGPWNYVTFRPNDDPMYETQCIAIRALPLASEARNDG